MWEETKGLEKPQGLNSDPALQPSFSTAKLLLQ